MLFLNQELGTLSILLRVDYTQHDWLASKTAGRKGKGPVGEKGEKGKGKGDASGFVRIPTLQPERAHARTNRNRNRFPGWSHSP